MMIKVFVATKWPYVHDSVLRLNDDHGTLQQETPYCSATATLILEYFGCRTPYCPKACF